jgi:hypothetical protein
MTIMQVVQQSWLLVLPLSSAPQTKTEPICAHIYSSMVPDDPQGDSFHLDCVRFLPGGN